MAISPSMVDPGRFTDAQREALTALGLGDGGARLRASNGKTRRSLFARGLIEHRPYPQPVGVRLTAEGQATVVAHGWVPELVLRSDDGVEQPEEAQGSPLMCRRCGLPVRDFRGVPKHSGGANATGCGKPPLVVERRAWEAELQHCAQAAVAVVRERSSWHPDRLDGTQIVARVVTGGIVAETVQHVQATYKRITGDDIEWLRVTIAGRMNNGQYSWSINLPDGHGLGELCDGRIHSSAIGGLYSITELEN